MKTILIPTDFSNNALMAADFAVSKLTDGPTKFVLLNVYNIPRGGTSGLFYLMEELQKQAEKDMAEFQSLLKEKYNKPAFEFETRLSQGDFADRCSQIGEELDVDCIVMGTKGSSGIKEILIGSSTIDLMKRLQRPLYVIPENFQEKEIDEVIISIDGKGFNEKAKKEVLNFATRHELPTTFLHVRVKEDNPIQEWNELTADFKTLTVERHETHGETLEEGLQKGLEGSNGLLVMIKRKLSFWERFFNLSDSQQAVMTAELPLLIIPE